MKALKLSAIFAALVFSGSAYSAGNNMFLEVGVGQSVADLPSAAGISVDDSDLTYSIGAGYMFTKNFGIEAGWRDLGEVSAKASGSYSDTIYGVPVTAVGDLTASAETSGWFLGVVADFPVTEKFSINGRAGYYFWESDLTASATGTLDVDGTVYAGSVAASASVDDSDPYFGLGVAYNFTKNVSLGVNYTRYTLEFDDVDYDVDVDVWDARLKYSF